MENGRIWGLFVLISVEVMISTSASGLINICDTTEEIILADTGIESFQVIDLDPAVNGMNAPCTLKIKASPTHLVHLRFQENDLELYRMMSSSRRMSYRPCILNIYVKDFEDKSLWSGDICSLDRMPDVDLLTPKIKLVWNPPESNLHLKGRKIIMNTVGKGDFCNRKDQHVCSRVGWTPSSCVSKQLICDKREDCPRGSTTSDEDDKFCNGQSSWKLMIDTIYKKAKKHPDIDKIMEIFEITTSSPPVVATPIQFKHWKEIHQIETTTSTPIQPPPKTLLSFIISQYGPWGYFLIGVLLFATALVFWCMWECCVRKHKAEHHVIAGTQLGTTPTTTLLIVNSYDDAQNAQQPPEYEDLDLPPSYSTLFPHEDKGSEDEDEETIPLGSIRIAGTSEEQSENT